MKSVRREWVLWLLLAMGAFGYIAILATPEGGYGTGVWPIGLGTACLVLGSKRQARLTIAAIAGIAMLTLLLGGRGVGTVLGFSAGMTLECSVAYWALVRPRWGERPALRTDADLRRFLAALVLASTVGGIVAGLTAAIASGGVFWRVALVLGLSHLASQLALVPFVTQLDDHPALATTRERLLQWSSTLILAPILFSVSDFPSLAVLLIPLLAWGAARCRPVEALIQQGAVLMIAITFTSLERGPFADIPSRYDVPLDARTASLAAFAVVCAMIVLPLILRVSAQLSVAREAAAQRDLLQRVLDGTRGVAILGTDASGVITLFNPGAERLLGYCAAEVVGRRLTFLCSPEARREVVLELGVGDRIEDVLQAMARRGEPMQHLRLQRADGVEREHRLTLSRLADQGDAATGWVVTSEDITDQQTQQRAMEEAVDRLRRLDALKDTFVSTVSHELRTPITSIRGYLEMLGAGEFGPLTAEQSRAVDRVSRNSTRLLKLIDELLALSSLDDAAATPVPSVLDLRETVLSGFDLVQSTTRAPDLELALDLPPHPVAVLGDADLLERALVNLIGNAVKFTGSSGSVLVDLVYAPSRGPGPGDVVISVADTGPGIPSEEVDQLFTRFFRSSVSQQAAIPGSGLGLAIADSIIRRHHGRIEVESQLGVGTTFRVVLPVADPGPALEPGNVQHSTTVRSGALASTTDSGD